MKLLVLLMLVGVLAATLAAPTPDEELEALYADPIDESVYLLEISGPSDSEHLDLHEELDDTRR